MHRRSLLLYALAALPIFGFVVPTWTAPAPFPKAGPKEITNSIGMKLVRIEPGKFMMGSTKEELHHKDDEQLHEVAITKAFYMGIHPVTQAEYQKVIGVNPSWFSATGGGKVEVQKIDTSNFPVEQVGWEDARQFCEKLSSLATEQERRCRYRLPRKPNGNTPAGPVRGRRTTAGPARKI